jgi:hypothetical protein
LVVVIVVGPQHAHGGGGGESNCSNVFRVTSHCIVC